MFPMPREIDLRAMAQTTTDSEKHLFFVSVLSLEVDWDAGLMCRRVSPGS